MNGRLERWLSSVEVDSIPALLVERYEVPTVFLLMLFMLWTRLRGFGNFVRVNGVYFAGNDAYYHFREVSYVVRHWPFTMGFDPWTRFPYGTSPDQFGTLFDQLIATAALLVGLGSPSDQTVALTLLVAPAVFGALVALPVYLLGRRLGGRPGGVFSVVVIAIIPGAFYQRSLVGFSDHHVAEVLFQATAVLASMVAVAVAEREKPVYELLLDRDWGSMRTPAMWSALAGVALGLYLWTWPPAVVLVGILGVYYLLILTTKTAVGRTPEHVAFAGVISMAVALVMTAAVLDTWSGQGITTLSPLQLALIAAVAAGCLFLAWFSRIWESRDLPQEYYPVAVGGIVVGSIAAVAVLLPGFFRTILNQALRNFGFGQTDTVLTIAEAQSVPFNALFSFMFDQYGLLYLSAAAGLAILVRDVLRTDSRRAERLLVVVWTVFILLMALTQIRFNYYLAVVVASLNGVTFTRTMGLLNPPTSTAELPDLKTYQIMTIIVIIVFVIAPLSPPLASVNVVSGGQQSGPGSVVTWTESLDWMENNTPAEGQYGGSTSELAYYGSFDRTDDFDYPAGTYGVMSWWDYGHWITVTGERIPVANPFQQGARPASAYLLADNETHANLLLEALPAGPTDPPLHEMSSEQLRSTIESQSAQQAGEDTRYVMIDDQMAAGKFGAIATWTGPGSGIYFGRQEVQVGDSRAQLISTNERYDETMLARLYFGDASGLSHYRLVHETNRTSSIVSVARQTQSGWTSDLNGDGRVGDYVNRRLDAQVFAAVQQNPSLAFYGVRQAASVKTFERVPGATLTGQVDTDNATTVFATVRLQTNTGRNVTYFNSVQTDADGSFELTVPYATNDAVGVEEGGTDSAVEATGDYRLFVGNPFQPSATGNASVPERAIYDADTIEVTFQAVERPSGNETNTSNSSSLGLPTGLDPGASLDSPDAPLDAPSTTATLAAEPRPALDG